MLGFKLSIEHDLSNDLDALEWRPASAKIYTDVLTGSTLTTCPNLSCVIANILPQRKRNRHSPTSNSYISSSPVWCILAPFDCTRFCCINIVNAARVVGRGRPDSLETEYEASLPLLSRVEATRYTYHCFSEKTRLDVRLGLNCHSHRRHRRMLAGRYARTASQHLCHERSWSTSEALACVSWDRVIDVVVDKRDSVKIIGRVG